MKSYSWWSGVVAVGLLVSACSSSSDPATTSSTLPGATTSTTSSVTTTTVAPAFDIPVEIVTPRNSQTLIATVDRGDGTLRAPVRLSATVEIPAGETVMVSWSSDLEGPLGSGAVLDVELGNDRKDVAGHQITVTVTSSGGGAGSAGVFVLVQVPSN